MVELVRPNPLAPAPQRGEKSSLKGLEGLAVGYRHRRPGGGAARDQAAVIRIVRRAVMGVDSNPGEGELGHVGAADQHRASGAQPRDRRRVISGRRRVVERLRPGEGPFAGDIEQVFYRDRKSGERGGDIARLASSVLGVGGGHCDRRTPRRRCGRPHRQARPPAPARLQPGRGCWCARRPMPRPNRARFC